ncbi:MULTISPECIES: DUF6360 family protein [Halorussus]|uniref:DUF6360 family protein n=1 Tax=Halorussus TaxID=1070314 RepID=UPI000E211C03|nr:MULTISPECIES: DUF6360 family protein [Halorussus]NHN58354.1 hypothetical protein [Halorussus sp. JP-T4]
MAGRVLDVTAYTTLDFVEAATRGDGWREEGTAVLDVRSPVEEPDTVVLDFEPDPASVERVEPHAHSVSLTADQARTLVEALEEAIDDEGSERPRRLRG